MYKKLTIENIKIFEKEQKLKITPLTLLYGENSSGKTTLLKTFYFSLSICEGDSTNKNIEIEYDQNKTIS